jgi:hypothetical protein
MVISVFKTSIQEKDLVSLPVLFNKIEGLLKWNTDLKDCDNILKIVSHKDIAGNIKKILNRKGFLCEEL